MEHTPIDISQQVAWPRVAPGAGWSDHEPARVNAGRSADRRDAEPTHMDLEEALDRMDADETDALKKRARALVLRFLAEAVAVDDESVPLWGHAHAFASAS
jgi:hypothetical protein